MCSRKQARAALQVLADSQQSAPQAVKQRAVHLSAQAAAASHARTSAPLEAAACFTCSGLVPHADQAQSSRDAAAHAAPGHRHRQNVTTTCATDLQLHSLAACLAHACAATHAFSAARTHSTEPSTLDAHDHSVASSALPDTADVPRSDTTMTQRPLAAPRSRRFNAAPSQVSPCGRRGHPQPGMNRFEEFARRPRCENPSARRTSSAWPLFTTTSSGRICEWGARRWPRR